MRAKTFLRFINESSDQGPLTREEVEARNPELAKRIQDWVMQEVLNFEDAPTESEAEGEALFDFLDRNRSLEDWAVWPNGTVSVALIADSYYFEWLQDGWEDFESSGDSGEEGSANVLDYTKGTVGTELNLRAQEGDNYLPTEFLPELVELFKDAKQKLRDLGFSDDDADLIAPFF